MICSKSKVLRAQLQCDQLCCNLSAWLQLVSFAASGTAIAIFKLSPLQTVSLAATVPSKCAFVNSAAYIQPSRNLSAVKYMYSVQRVYTVQLHFVTGRQFVCSLYSVTRCRGARFSFHTVSLGSCAVRDSTKCSDVAAWMIAGSIPRVVPDHGSCQNQYV